MIKIDKRNVLIACLIIIVVLLLVALFRGHNSQPGDQLDLTKELIRAKDETIAAEKAHRQALEKLQSDYNKRDSVLALALQNNKPKYVSNEKKYENIPATVHDLSRDDLRRAAVEY